PSESPVSLSVDIAEPQCLLQSRVDPGYSIRDFASDKFDPPQGRFMVEQDAARCVKLKTLPVIDGAPVSKKFGDTIGASGVKWCVLVLYRLSNFAEHFAGRRLVKTRLRINNPHRLQHAERANARHFCRKQRLIPRRGDKALRAEIGNFLCLRLLQRPDQR